MIYNILEHLNKLNTKTFHNHKNKIILEHQGKTLHLTLDHDLVHISDTNAITTLNQQEAILFIKGYFEFFQ